jgi:mannonate dehydratase
MDRRNWLAQVSLAGGMSLPLFSAGQTTFGQVAAPAGTSPKKLEPLKIADIKTILTAPAGIRLVVVKVTTNEPGLYGLGCATFTQRARVVETAVDKYLKPFLIGKDVTAIEDTFQSAWLKLLAKRAMLNSDQRCRYGLWDIL